MSHIGKYTCRIRNANMTLAKATLQILEKTKRITWTENGAIRDYYGNTQRHSLVVNIGRGIAISTENGELAFITDEYGQQREVREFQQTFEQYYRAMAATAALRQMGYSVSMTEQDGELRIGANQL